MKIKILNPFLKKKKKKGKMVETVKKNALIFTGKKNIQVLQNNSKLHYVGKIFFLFS